MTNLYAFNIAENIVKNIIERRWKLAWVTASKVDPITWLSGNFGDSASEPTQVANDVSVIYDDSDDSNDNNDSDVHHDSNDDDDGDDCDDSDDDDNNNSEDYILYMINEKIRRHVHLFILYKKRN
ncbi:hypothetical protein C1645_820319 [Glomus cerebriforme]|uniref:Uncharacterized protein n=1 Tax=Glomus cerebriforme TaxID=658196 RepID=A0A397T8N0_9GLOM|nr:hypothetical protein C1645_820319 [Glomus cerebriforme]